MCDPPPGTAGFPGALTVCGQDYDPAAFDSGAVAWTLATAGPHPEFVDLSLNCEWVVWVQAEDGSVFEPLDSFPLDPARGSNQAFGFRTGLEEFGPFALSLEEEGFFSEPPTNTVVAIADDEISFFVPATELHGPVQAVRGYTFCTEGNYDAADSVADSTELFPVATPAALSLAAPPPAVSTSSSSTTTSTSTTTTTVAAAPGSEPPPESGEEGGGSFPIALPVILLLIAGAALWIWIRRTRTRGRPEPPPMAPTPADDEPSGGCDWALYVVDGTTRTVLRPADGMECCVYEVAITTFSDVHDEAVKGRQDATSPQGVEASVDERLRMADLEYGYSGSSLWGWVSARSGPAGRLDWMQGLGDPRERAGRVVDASPEAQVSQLRALEEGPELAASLTHLESTAVHVTLTAGCPGHDNTYAVEGNSEAYLRSTYECTNAAPGPECPVEFTAAGWVEGLVAGDLAYYVGEDAASDVDEIEPVAERLRQLLDEASPVALTDSHDHATRARDTFESSKTGSGTSVVRRDDLQVWLLSGLRLHAGTTVPVAVWSSTERVSADIYTDLLHDLSVSATMDRGNCEGSSCGGHGRCRCTPTFKLNVVGSQATLTVDGTDFDLVRPSASGPWRLV